MVDIVSPELLEDELNAVTRVGNYGSQAQAIGHVLELLLVANPRLRIDTAMELYRQDRVTLTRAAEIAGLELDTFKQRLAEQNIAIAVDELPDEVREGADLISRLRKAP
jgi:predicted HTH domain antitoxin